MQIPETVAGYESSVWRGGEAIDRGVDLMV
jgi:hypothetical protein